MHLFTRIAKIHKHRIENSIIFSKRNFTYFESNRYKITFILLILIFQVPHVFESFWYDEAALVENLSNSSVSSYFTGLNWLQTVPFGYFLIAKVFFLSPYGVLICRSLSLLFLVLSIILVDKHLIKGKKNLNLRYTFLFLAIVNSAAIRYGTDVKPYTLELYFSILSLLIVKKEKIKQVFLIIVLIPFFSSTGFIILSASLLASSLIHRKMKYILICFCNLMFTFFISTLIPLTTRTQMKNVWFGLENSFTLSSFKGAIGNSLWFATSGFGLLPDNFGAPYSYLISATLTTAIGLIIMLHFKFEFLHLTLLLSGLMMIFLQFGHIAPIAGRLFLGFSLLVLYLFLDSLSLKKLKIISIISICFALIVNLNTLKIDNNRIYLKPADFDSSSKIYTDLNLAPEVRFMLGNSRFVLRDNLILGVEKGIIYTCKEIEFNKGDIMFLSNSLIRNLVDSRTFKDLIVTEATDMVTKVVFLSNYISSKSQRAESFLECKYIFRNPNQPKI
jgi:hypothetical protein